MCGVRCRGKDFASAAPLQSSACDAEGVTPPSDVVDLVGVRGVASSFACVSGSLGAESGVEDRGVSLDSAEVKGVGAMGVTQGEEEVPAELVLVVKE